MGHLPSPVLQQIFSPMNVSRPHSQPATRLIFGLVMGLIVSAVPTAASANLSDITGPNVSDITGPNVSDITGPNVSDITGTSTSNSTDSDEDEAHPQSSRRTISNRTDLDELAKDLKASYESCQGGANCSTFYDLYDQVLNLLE